MTADGYRVLERDGAQAWFGIEDEDMDSFWDHYITSGTGEGKLPEWFATTVFNNYMYNEGWFEQYHEWSAEDDQFMSHFYYSDEDKDGELCVDELIQFLSVDEMTAEDAMEHYGSASGKMDREAALQAINDKRLGHGMFGDDEEEEE